MLWVVTNHWLVWSLWTSPRELACHLPRLVEPVPLLHICVPRGFFFPLEEISLWCVPRLKSVWSNSVLSASRPCPADLVPSWLMNLQQFLAGDGDPLALRVDAHLPQECLYQSREAMPTVSGPAYLSVCYSYWWIFSSLPSAFFILHLPFLLPHSTPKLRHCLCTSHWSWDVCPISCHMTWKHTQSYCSSLGLLIC